MKNVMASLSSEDAAMAPSQPSLPSNRVFVVQFRHPPCGGTGLL